MDVQTERAFAMVSAVVSAGDGVQYDYLAAQPPALQLPPVSFTGVGGVSAPMLTMLEVLRRCFTNITTPSTTIVSGGSAGSVALAFGTATPSGIAGMFQGVPFVLSAAGTLSAQPTSLISTASNQIRKVLVTIGMSALPVASSLALGGGTVQFVYGQAVTVSAGAVTSGGQGLSYFDYLPLPQCSAGEIPMGWINVPNSFATSAGIPNSCMFTDYRVTQGINLSAMMQGVPQP
jgi:hypothetical protein